MYSLKVKNNKGDELQLTGNPNYSIIKIEGLNPPPATLNKTANSTKDGSRINSARVESRNVVIYIRPHGDIEKNRIQLYKYFPNSKEVTLYFKNHSRDVSISGVVETLELNHCDNPQIAQVSIVCPEPYFKDTKELSVQFGELVPLFEFPFSIPAEGMEFSRYAVNYRKNIINTGDTDTGAVIKLYALGDVSNPTIYDITNGTQMKLNITMKKGDTVLIDTNFDKKSITLIREGKSTNLLGYMRPDSDWFTLTAGNNIYAYECESGAVDLQLTVQAPVLYSGV